jgi:spore maturation protein B
MGIVNTIASAIVPALIALVVIYGFIKRVDVYDAFVEGAKEGLHTAARILPYMAAMMLAVGMVSQSGGFDLLKKLIDKPMAALGVPSDVLPIFITRPFSGSAAMAVLADLFARVGPDSFTGRLASTMMGSSETIFYTTALYFGSVRIKKTRWAIPVALCSEVVGFISSVCICTWMFN